MVMLSERIISLMIFEGALQSWRSEGSTSDRAGRRKSLQETARRLFGEGKPVGGGIAPGAGPGTHGRWKRIDVAVGVRRATCVMNQQEPCMI